MSTDHEILADKPHRQVQRLDVLGQAAHRDIVDSRLGDLPDTHQVDVAGRLQAGTSMRHLNRLAEIVQTEVIEQDMGCASRQCLAQLGKGLDLDLDLHPGGCTMGRHDRLSDGACGHDVVLLEQDRIVEAHAMVMATAATDRILLLHTQAGHRLAGIEDTHGKARDGIGIGACTGRGCR